MASYADAGAGAGGGGEEWDVHAAEDRDGIRFSWGLWPSTRLGEWHQNTALHSCTTSSSADTLWLTCMCFIVAPCEPPPTITAATRAVVPVACVYTPLAFIEGSPIVDYAPVRCKGNGCGSVLNPFW